MTRRILQILMLTGAMVGASLAAQGQQVVRKTLAPANPDMTEMVVSGNDTVPNVMPERNLGRYDRGLYNYMFVPRGSWGFGLTASYGELSTENMELLSMVTGIDFKGKMYSVKPFISYFFRHNQSIGLRFNYSRGIGDLDGLAMDFSDDMSFNLHDISYYTQSFSSSLFYRNYIGLNKSRRFGIFNEVDLTAGSGYARFKRPYNDLPRDTKTLKTQLSLNFSPGVCIFIQENVGFNVSFGVFGLHMTREHQYTDEVDEGTRFTSGANFRFNIFNINFGMLVVI